jgi:hypothetical protein
MVEQVSDTGDGHVSRWKASQHLPVHGIVALARKHGLISDALRREIEPFSRWHPRATTLSLLC